MSTSWRLIVSAWVLPAFLAVYGTPATAGGLAPDLDTHLKKKPKSSELVRVIAQFNRPGIERAALARSAGGRVVRDLSGIGGASLELPLKGVEWLARHPHVAWVSPDRTLGADWDYSPQALGADQVWTGGAGLAYRGTGTRVAVLDTGIAANLTDLNRWPTPVTRVVGWKDFVNHLPTRYDDHGHGTHVAGIIAGGGQASNGRFKGVAPDVDLVVVKVLDSTGQGTVSNVIAGIDWCIANKATYNLRALNLSLGHDPVESSTTDPLCAAVRRAVDAGLVVVCSAGNKGKDDQGMTRYGGISCPGNEPAAITVGALNTHETIGRGDDGACSYSSRGPTFIDHLTKPDVLAPGNRIVSLRAPGSWLDTHYTANRVLPQSYGGFSPTPSYYTLSGTSMAAPQVTGTVALMLQANPNLKPNAVKGILMFTAQPLSPTDGLGAPLADGLSVLTHGAGSVNTLGAVEVARKVNASAPVGSPWLTAGLSEQSTIGGASVAWSLRVLQAGKVVEGEDLLGIRQPLWGGDVNWGDQVIWGGQVTWGDDLVPQEQVTWGNDSLWGLPNLWGTGTPWEGFFLLTILGE